ncbi:hypothetical protein KP509_03G090200 [Ceratopteris richardii]|uniref:DUF7953 domain-containing protein n=1 Tax=Ceratopteris richardii TaxID=49495 RepID=A0A8T2V948_CERRI|nr:hypothetical protein KP509_03G090200 [Ceratopteris richardii]
MLDVYFGCPTSPRRCDDVEPPDALGKGNVTLESLTIFRTHEWFGEPTVYFRCQGEKKVYLPDVVKENQQYDFIGQESWQPLTELEDTKCKRCGLYEEDRIKHDDVFDEWELCPVQFSPEPEGRYHHFKDNELNMTLSCYSCHASGTRTSDEPDASKDEDENGTRKSSFWVFIIAFFGILAFLALAYLGYMKWQQKKREEQQARFIKLFEDDEDLEVEFGLRD